jgi:hypothetical protein
LIATDQRTRETRQTAGGRRRGRSTTRRTAATTTEMRSGREDTRTRQIIIKSLFVCC